MSAFRRTGLPYSRSESGSAVPISLGIRCSPFRCDSSLAPSIPTDWTATCVRCPSVDFEWMPHLQKGFDRHSMLVGRDTLRYRDFAL